jgi:PAS domain S-box-containing protein
MTDTLKQREGALKDELLFQQALFESAGVGIMLQRGDLITRCNRKMEELLHFPPGSLTENTFSGLLPDIGNSFTEEAIRDGIALDLQLTRLDGSTFWARLIRSRIDKNSIAKGYIWGVSDITDILSAAQSMRIAKESAEQADHVKSMFLANMSHEIRTPMNGVIGMAQLALKTGLDNKQRDYVQKIYQSGKSLLVIINDILDFSKLEAGKLELEDKTFDLDEILSKVSTFVGPAIAKKPIELLYRLGKEVPQAVSGDPLRLAQVLTNLGKRNFDGGSAAGDGGPCTHRIQGTGYRHWHDRRAEKTYLRFLFASRHIHYPKIRRNRTGTGNLQADYRIDVWGNHCRQPARCWLDIPILHPA